jgi:hypothetical protein
MEQNEKITLQKLKKEMEEMREEYERRLAGASQLPTDSKKSIACENMRRMQKEQEDWLNEYVEIKLFKDNDRYKDDVYVAINGKNCVIRRGEWTRIRRKFAMLLDQSEIQDLHTAQMMENESEKFRAASRVLGA